MSGQARQPLRVVSLARWRQQAELLRGQKAGAVGGGCLAFAPYTSHPWTRWASSSGSGGSTGWVQSRTDVSPPPRARPSRASVEPSNQGACLAPSRLIWAQTAGPPLHLTTLGVALQEAAEDIRIWYPSVSRSVWSEGLPTGWWSA